MRRKIIAGLCAFGTVCSAAAGPLRLTDYAAFTALAARVGDIDGNDRLDADDARVLAGYLLSKSGSASGADLDSDGIVCAKDLTVLKRQLLGATQGTGGLRINEVCSTNKKSLKAADGTSPDWIELFNAGSAVCDLSGIGVSDGDKNRYKFTFPQGSKLASSECALWHSG